MHRTAPAMQCMIRPDFEQSMRRNTALTSLCIGDAAFGDEATIALVEGLRSNQTLRHLDLENKGLGPQGLEALGSVLAGGAGLQTLNLARNSFGTQGTPLFLKHVSEAESEILARGVSLLLGCCGRGRGGGREALEFAR